MSKENISQELRLRNIDERRNYFLEEIEQNEIISNKHKKGLYNSKLYWRRLLASLLGIPLKLTSTEI